jgi:hypothetical protein
MTAAAADSAGQDPPVASGTRDPHDGSLSQLPGATAA